LGGTEGKSHALVVLPRSSAEMPGYRRWLSRSHLEWTACGELLMQVLSVLGVTPPSGGLGALRLWGQTGARPHGWVAAADPVYLEARLDHLSLHPLPPSELPAADVSEIFDYLQDVLGIDGHSTFASVGTCGYLHYDRPLATAEMSPVVARGETPGEYLPQGDQAKAYDRLQSEVQMCLHESVVNERRARTGLRPVNALWLWGGGVAAASSPTVLPPLYADDPLMTGYWLSRAGAVSPWPGNLEACLQGSAHGFVAIFPEASPDAGSGGDPPPGELRRMLRRGGLRGLTLLFRDGLRADVRRWDALRFWHRPAPISERGRP
jgi:hypothetical protein